MGSKNLGFTGRWDLGVSWLWGVLGTFGVRVFPQVGQQYLGRHGGWVIVSELLLEHTLRRVEGSGFRVSLAP